MCLLPTPRESQFQTFNFKFELSSTIYQCHDVIDMPLGQKKIIYIIILTIIFSISINILILSEKKKYIYIYIIN